MKFKVLAHDKNSLARVGQIELGGRTIDTPCFMPVGTKGAVKTLEPSDLKEIGVQIILSNTYHLAVRPGEELIAKLGGLDKFMSWDGPILTDSGGYQIFSLLKLRKLTRAGVEFNSHVDGKPFYFTPEKVIEIQTKLGSNIIMPLDYPVNYGEKTKADEALDITCEWFERSLKVERKGELFGITQGAFDKNLREKSTKHILSFDPPGIAVGGLSLGEPKDVMYETARFNASIIPNEKPRYAMGIGRPEDIINFVAFGYDMFDCILPTRLGRNGWAFTQEGLVKIKNSVYSKDERPVDPSCACRVCKMFSRAYIRHCFNVEEILGLDLLSYHNVYYYIRLMERVRSSIMEGTFNDLWEKNRLLTA